MPAPATAQELYDLIARSGVQDAARVRGYVDRLAAAGGPPADPTALAGRMVADGFLTRFQADNLLQGRWKRFFIGKYKVLERLGVGGMGQVFLCEHKLMKRRVAVKVLPAAKAKDQAALQRFYREARAVAALDHPNIVRAYDIDDDGGLHFLVMEYVDGTNLHDLIRTAGPLPVSRACHYVYGTCVGLQHAHENGLVHRDIKPANILVDRAGVVKILDLGLARFFHPEEDDRLTLKFDETVLGTADYLAPEQAIDSSTVDIRADLYGLGGTFHFLLAGQPPFPDGSIAQKLLWHQSKPPRPIRELRSDVAPELAAVVARMLAKDPAERYQTPFDVMADLEPWIRTPIAPPADHELPPLAGGGGSRPASSGPVSSHSYGPLSSPLIVKPAAAPPVVATATAPEPAEPNSVWESITSMETLPTATRDTAKDRPPGTAVLTDDDPTPPSAEARKARLRPGSRAARKTSPAGPIAAAVVGGLVVVGGGAAAVLYLDPLGLTRTTPAARPRVEREPTTWYVSDAGPDPAHTRRSLAEIAADLRSGDTVVFLADVVDSGPVRLASGKTPLKNVKLVAGNPAKSVTWTYQPSAATPRAFLELVDVENVTVSGLVFDVGGKLEVGVQVSGAAAGVTIEDVTVRNPKATGFRVVNATAAADRPLTLARCRVVGGPTLEAAVAVIGSSRTGTAHVQVTGCRLEGAGKGAAVRVDGAVGGGRVANCRVFQFEHGVHVPTVGDKFGLTIERNTFHTLTRAGLKVDAPLSADRPLALTRNYFAATPLIGQVAGDARLVQATDNGHDPGSRPGQVAATVVTGVTIPKPTPNTPDDQFLIARPGTLVVGPAKTPVGAD